jgi:hypothetical protein
VDAQVHDPPGEPNGQGHEPADQPAGLAGQANKPTAQANEPSRQATEPSRQATEPADRANEPADRANEQKGLRALFRNASSADQTSGITADEEPTGDGKRPASRQQFAGQMVSRPLVSPRLRSDPRLRVWVTRALVALALYLVVIIWRGWHDWRYGLTAAVIYAAADTIFRSKTAVVVPASVRITSAQRSTRRRLKLVRLAGYHAMHARTIPGTKHVIDHVVVGPAGVFTFDSQRLDRRLPLRMRDGMLYHGRASMEPRLDHARLEAGYAKRLIENELGQPVAIRPAMVVYGPSTSWMIMRVKGVDVFDGHRIGTYFRRQSNDVRRGSARAKSRLSAERIEMIIAAAERALPALT